MQEPTIQQGSQLIQPYTADDSTYSLMIHIMKAFFYQGNGDMYKDTFDKAFRRDRFNIEIVLVKLKNSWIVLKYLDFVVPYACQIVIMCCVLHNFCRMNIEQL